MGDKSTGKWLKHWNPMQMLCSLRVFANLSIKNYILPFEINSLPQFDCGKLFLRLCCRKGEGSGYRMDAIIKVENLK